MSGWREKNEWKYVADKEPNFVYQESEDIEIFVQIMVKWILLLFSPL